MARLILLTDLAEEYAKRLLAGIVQYSKDHEPWTVCKMPLTYRDIYGIRGVIDWALRWKADAIIGQFFNTDHVSLFRENGIIALAQDFKSRFPEIPNITGDHYKAGTIGAEYFIKKGFKNFGFFGFKDIVWSEERYEGFKSTLLAHDISAQLFEYQNLGFKDLWYYDYAQILEWLKILPKPIAIMACDDNQGHHIAEICKQYGYKIPEEIALLGVDNDEAICSLSDPPLSSINQAVERGGWEAARLITTMMHDSQYHWQDIIVEPTNIITRESTDIYATSDGHIAKILKYIHQNIDTKLNINDITQLVPLSRRLLEVRFKKVTGYPIYEYISNLRIDKFSKKLIETDLAIVEIAMDMGFGDYKNISRQFKKVKGCTPSEYRRKYSLTQIYGH